MGDAVRLIDARGIMAPLPILDLRRAMDDMSPGESLEVISDDESISGDIHMFISATGHELEVSGEDDDGVKRFRVRKS